MRIKVFCIPFDESAKTFDDERLQSFCKTTKISSITEHFFSQSDKQYLAVSVQFTPPAQQFLESDDLAAEDHGLFEILRKWRAERSYKDGVPPYVLLTNRQLLAVIKNRPQSKTELMKISGIGQAKADRYGDEILSFIKMGAPEQASLNV